MSTSSSESSHSSIPKPKLVQFSSTIAPSHVRNWTFPVPCNETKWPGSNATPLRDPLTAQAILRGQTIRPISLDDLKTFLGRPQAGGRTNVDLTGIAFLLEFHAYKSRFFGLPSGTRAPPPQVVIEHLAILSAGQRNSGLSPPVPTKDTPPPSPIVFDGAQNSYRDQQPREAGICPHSFRCPLQTPNPTTAAGSLPSICDARMQLPVLLDPTVQPLRLEMERLVQGFFGPNACPELSGLLPQVTLAKALSEVELTTHPDVLQPIADFLLNRLNTVVLPEFFNKAVSNLSRSSTIIRSALAFVLMAISLALGVVFVSYPKVFPKVARLGLAPLVLLALGCIAGSATGVCGWLAYKGIREPKTYEQVDTATSETEGRTNGTTSEGLTSLPPPPPLIHVRPYSIYTINANDSTAMLDAGLLPVRTKDSARGPSPAKDLELGQMSFHPLMEPEKGWRKWMKRSRKPRPKATIQVEDRRVRRAQIKVAVRTSFGILVGTALLITLLMVLP